MAPPTQPRTTTRPLPTEFQRAAESWLVHLRAARKSPRTLTLYLSGLHSLVAFLEARGMPTDPHSVTSEHLREYLADQVAHLSPATARARHSYLSVFWNWMVDEGEINLSPMRRIKPPALDDTPPPTIPHEDIERLLKTCKGSKSLTDRQGKPTVRPHLFRHTWASELKAEGLGDENLMALGGWRSRHQMSKYGKVDETRRAVDAYRKLRG